MYKVMCTGNALDFQKYKKVWQDSLTDFAKYCFLSINPFPLLLIAKSISKIYHPFFSALLEHHYKSKHLKTYPALYLFMVKELGKPFLEIIVKVRENTAPIDLRAQCNGTFPNNILQISKKMQRLTIFFCTYKRKWKKGWQSSFAEPAVTQLTAATDSTISIGCRFFYIFIRPLQLIFALIFNFNSF